ncbi:unnamed protein product, partial [Ascophyllum nodosum]
REAKDEKEETLTKLEAKTAEFKILRGFSGPLPDATSAGRGLRVRAGRRVPA